MTITIDVAQNGKKGTMRPIELGMNSKWSVRVL